MGKNCCGCSNSINACYENGQTIFEVCKCELLPNKMTVDRFNPGKWCPMVKGCIISVVKN